MRRRARLVSDRRRFQSSRRRRARADGRVGLLGSGEAVPSRSRCSSRSRAISRLRACDRVSSTVTRRSGLYRSMSLRRVSGDMDPASARSRVASTLVLERLACCPPGPPEGLNRQVTSTACTVPPPKVSTRSTRRNLPPSPTGPFRAASAQSAGDSQIVTADVSHGSPNPGTIVARPDASADCGEDSRRRQPGSRRSEVWIIG